MTASTVVAGLPSAGGGLLTGQTWAGGPVARQLGGLQVLAFQRPALGGPVAWGIMRRLRVAQACAGAILKTAAEVFMFKRPDWKDAKAYAALKGATLTQLAWEFLRRNDAYAAAWATFVAEAAVLEDGHEHMVPTAPDAGSIAPLMAVRGRAWGLDAMADPEGGVPRFERSGARYAATIGAPEVPKTPANPDGDPMLTPWLHLQLDLSLPLEVIEAAALRAIRDQRKSRISRGVVKPVTSRAVRPELYVEYLRILDGTSAGATIAEIGGVLAPGAANDVDRQRDKRLRAALKTARALQATGYAVLPLLQPVRKSVKKK